MRSFKLVENFKIKRIVIRGLKVVLLITLFLYIAQTFFAHRHPYFTPSYEKINLDQISTKEILTEQDYQTLFLQTGLGKPSINYLIENDDNYKQTLKTYQNHFFEKPNVKCNNMIWIITKEDIVINDNERDKIPPLINTRPGDILVTTSTHTAGYRHGHSALVIRKGRTLECCVLGSTSQISTTSSWQRYSNYAVLRVKNSSKDLSLSVAEYAYNNLVDIPYHLSCGLFGAKATAVTSPFFGLNCGYLVWYAWQEKGVDMDSDGGRIVTPNDILKSDKLEVLQLYGMNPKDFL